MPGPHDDDRARGPRGRRPHEGGFSGRRGGPGADREARAERGGGFGGRPRSRGGKAPLSRDAVVNAAVACLAEGGSGALTMRGVARKLQTGPSSLYAHVANQNELCSLVLNKVAASVPLIPDGIEGAAAAEAILLGYERALMRTPGAAGIALHTVPAGEASLDLFERMLRALDEAGVSQEQSFYAGDALMLLVTASVAEHDSRLMGGGDVDGGAWYSDLLASSPVRRPYMESLFTWMHSQEGGTHATDPGVQWAVRVFLKGLER